MFCNISIILIFEQKTEQLRYLLILWQSSWIFTESIILFLNTLKNKKYLYYHARHFCSHQRYDLSTISKIIIFFKFWHENGVTTLPQYLILINSYKILRKGIWIKKMAHDNIHIFCSVTFYLSKYLSILNDLIDIFINLMVAILDFSETNNFSKPIIVQNIFVLL